MIGQSVLSPLRIYLLSKWLPYEEIFPHLDPHILSTIISDLKISHYHQKILSILTFYAHLYITCTYENRIKPL